MDIFLLIWCVVFAMVEGFQLLYNDENRGLHLFSFFIQIAIGTSTLIKIIGLLY